MPGTNTLAYLWVISAQKIKSFIALMHDLGTVWNPHKTRERETERDGDNESERRTERDREGKEKEGEIVRE